MRLISNYFLFFFCLSSCSNNKISKSAYSSQSLLDKVFNDVDSMSNSYPKEYPVKLFKVSSQNYNNSQYYKIATGIFYNKDSVQNCFIYKSHIILFYFKIDKESTKNCIPMNLAYNDSIVPLYHNRYLIFKKTPNRFLNIRRVKELPKAFMEGDESVLIKRKPKK